MYAQTAQSATTERTPDAAFFPSAHFIERQRQRHVDDAFVALAIKYGRRYYDRGDIVYFLGRRNLPAYLGEREARRAEGTVVIVGHDACLLTTYRNPRRCRALKRRA